jgi:hypothetical protein
MTKLRQPHRLPQNVCRSAIQFEGAYGSVVKKMRAVKPPTSRVSPVAVLKERDVYLITLFLV